MSAGLGFGRRYDLFLAAACVLLFGMVVWIHAPGHLTVDTSIHLEEARTGRPLGWSPPFMSAWLYYLGGGRQSTTLFVAINAAIHFTAIWLLGRSRGRHVGLARRVVTVVALLSPVALMYLGIVWKDVLFASGLIISTTALFMLHDARRDTAWWLWLCVALLSAGALPLIRQQGMICAPFVWAAALSETWLRYPGRRLRRLPAVAALAVVSVLLVRAWVWDAYYIKPGTQSVDTGMRTLELYDLVGIESHVGAGPLTHLLGPRDVAALEQQYGPDRVDRINAAAVEKVQAERDAGWLRSQWTTAVRSYPGAYTMHRADVFAWLLGIHGAERCLPLTLGVQGIPAYLAASGLSEDTSDWRRPWLWQHLKPMFSTPLWAHWSYVLLVCGVLVYLLRLQWADRVGPLLVVGSLLATVASFAFVSIACDFRYMYFLIPLAPLVWMRVLGQMESRPLRVTHVR